MERRSFIKTASGAIGAGATASVAGQPAVAEPSITESPPTHLPDPVAGMPRRKLGRTPLQVSVATFPGLVLMRDAQDRCNEMVIESFERGVNYFDVAPAYGKDGECEIKMGVALQALDREDYVLSCKTKARDKRGAQEELDRSLKRLKTDHFDLYQLHCFIKPQEVVQALGPGGAMETLLDAQRAGKIRHIGFSAHTTKSAIRALRHFDFDTVMFPINFAEYYTIGMGKQVLELARQKDTAVLGMKTLAFGRWPKDIEKTRNWWYRTVETDQHVQQSLDFTLGFDGVVTAVPPSWWDLWDKTIDACKALSPHSDKTLTGLRQLANGCESVFHRFEQSLADNRPDPGIYYADSPHELPPCMIG